MRGQTWARRLHRTADRVDIVIHPTLRRAPAVERLWIAVLDLIVAGQADRRYLSRTILPAIRQAAPRRLLFVGVRGYTRSYADVFRGTRTEYWTSDIDPAAARYGSPERHVVGDLREIDSLFPPGHFELVIVNGVLGWGIDTPADMDRALYAIDAVLAGGGILLLGWNSDRIDDPAMVAALQELFEPTAFAGLPQRRSFDDVTHVYAWYRKRAR